MEAYVITLIGNEYSERVAKRCIESANIPVSIFPAETPLTALNSLDALGVGWTWGNESSQQRTGLNHHSYGGNGLSRIACALSHYRLWLGCREETLILEHDAVFIRDFEPIRHNGICQINDPRRATPRGDWWHQRMAERGPGVWPITRVFEGKRPDGLAGNSAYLIKPHAAEFLVSLVREYGLWPNDAIMCRQLVPFLNELYPYMTEVRAEQSTI